MTAMPVLVAFNAADADGGRALVAALEQASIGVETFVLDDTVESAFDSAPQTPPAGTTYGLVIAFFGTARASPALLDLVDRATEAAVPLVVVRAPGAQVELRASVQAHAAAAETRAGRSPELSALYGRVTAVVSKFEASRSPASTTADHPVAPQAGSGGRDQGMVSDSGDAAMMSRAEPWRPPSIFLDPPAYRPDVQDSWNKEVERAVEQERAGRGVTTAPSTPSPPSAALDSVHFGVTCPNRLASPGAAVVDVWVFREDQRRRVLEMAREEHDEPTSLVTQGPVRIAPQTQLHARVWFEDLEVPDPVNELLWNREIGKATFIVRAPAGLAPGPRRGRITILLSGLPIARLVCVVAVKAHETTDDTATRTTSYTAARRRKAFASYASRDRREVVARVHGLEKAGIDVFMDVKSLRSGEHYEARLLDEITSRDVFFLFWSKAASVSRWVEREWRFALAKRGADFIDPVPLVAPDDVPPPRELAETLHFADWTLAYTTARALAPPRWWQFWRQ